MSEQKVPYCTANEQRDIFTIACELIGFHCVKEFRFDNKRRWRADYCIPEFMIIIEVEGGAYTRGRHTRPIGFINDMEKYNAATLAGYRVFRVTPNKLMTEGIRLVREATTIK